MSQEGAKEALIPLQATMTATGGGGEHFEMGWRKIGHGAGLQVRPGVLDGVEVRCIRRQEGCARPQGLPEYLVNLRAAVGLEAIPNYDRTARQVASETADKLHDLGNANIAIRVEPKEERQLVAAWWNA